MRTPGRLLLLAVLAACAAPPELPDYAPRPVRTLATFEVRQDGRYLGSLKELEIVDPRGPVRFFRVENADRQYVGFADAAGRFYKQVPFHEREQFLGIYPMESGLALLSEVEAPLTVAATATKK